MRKIFNGTIGLLSIVILTGVTSGNVMAGGLVDTGVASPGLPDGPPYPIPNSKEDKGSDKYTGMMRGICG